MFGNAISLYGGLLTFLVFAFVLKKMAKAGNPFFKFGYYLYTKTKVGQVYYRRELSKARRKFPNGSHSVCEAKVFNGLKVLPIAMSLDNYGYLVCDKRTGTAVLVDPADVDKVQQVLKSENVTPSAILCTHKHWDHSGGNVELKRLFPDIRIYGCAVDDIPACTDQVLEGDTLNFGQLQFTVYATPGHTVGHIVFLLEAGTFGAPPSIFSGDHIFLAGVGRMFEGAPNLMLRSLDHFLSLPQTALIWPGHEYAQDNLEFAASLEPENENITEKLKWVQERRRENLSTCPSSIAEEMEYNPFLRTSEPTILKAIGIDKKKAEITDEVRSQALAELRSRKDKFKYKL